MRQLPVCQTITTLRHNAAERGPTLDIRPRRRDDISAGFDAGNRRTELIGVNNGGEMPPGSECRDDRHGLRWGFGVAANSTTDSVGGGLWGRISEARPRLSRFRHVFSAQYGLHI